MRHPTHVSRLVPSCGAVYALNPEATIPSSHRPLKRNNPGGEIGCCGSPCFGPCRPLALRMRNIGPPVAIGSCGRRQSESHQRLNLLKREHDDGGVAMFEVGVESPVLARNGRRTLLHGKGDRCALGNRRGPTPPNPNPLKQGHTSVKYVAQALTRHLQHGRGRRAGIPQLERRLSLWLVWSAAAIALGGMRRPSDRRVSDARHRRHKRYSSPNSTASHTGRPVLI